MFKSKKTITLLILVVCFSMSLGFYHDARNYFAYRSVAEATGGMPFMFGGTITYYMPKCQSDPLTGVCANCPMCTIPGIGVGNYICNAYQEIQYIPAGGTHPAITNVCVPLGFVYKGGGTMPRIGGQIRGGGASNIMPWVIGIGK